MKRSFLLLASLMLAAGLALPAQTKPAAPPKPLVRHVLSAGERGERVYQANCSRCHYPPDQLNPRITGTVIRHMRVRANLSAQDERDILKFFNP